MCSKQAVLYSHPLSGAVAYGMAIGWIEQRSYTLTITVNHRLIVMAQRSAVVRCADFFFQPVLFRDL